ncbi:pentapeptide repeat-containing protein [Phytohabitans suffuscus]|uniref:Pentapeptide repeat protein n=1 Tax=Phytohabitans suffuscus TaxID=624315 RepID=A0A6F8YST4_9ACTN|nr:hypothetical protein Psuf_065230 [Phytohabitans suffuscus]
MAASTPSGGPQGAEFVGADLRGARFVGTDLPGVVMRSVDVQGADIDSPWLFDGGFLRVNGVDVIPYVEATLNRRFPAASTGAPAIRRACAWLGPCSSAPGDRAAVPSHRSGAHQRRGRRLRHLGPHGGHTGE